MPWNGKIEDGLSKLRAATNSRTWFPIGLQYVLHENTLRVDANVGVANLKIDR